MENAIFGAVFREAKNCASAGFAKQAVRKASALGDAIQIAIVAFDQSDDPTAVLARLIPGEMMQDFESGSVRLHSEDGPLPFSPAVFECAVNKTVRALKECSGIAAELIEVSDEFAACFRKRRWFRATWERWSGAREQKEECNRLHKAHCRLAAVIAPIDKATHEHRQNRWCDVYLHATLVGTVPVADRFGRLNKALYFDGNLDRVVCGNDAAFNFTNAFTVAAWVKLDGPQLNNYVVTKYDFDFGTSTGEPNSYGLGLNGSIDPYCFVGGDIGYSDLRGFVNLNDDSWHFLSMTYDSGLLRLFLDGVPIRQGGTGLLPPFINSVPLTIGGTASGQGFRGAIDSVRLYNRALSGLEMAALYLK
jgi:hypothetical protein